MPIASNSGTVSANLDLCYQTSAGGPLVNFVGGGYSVVEIDTNRTPMAVVASVVPGPGEWKVGACIKTTATTITDNDFVNGWVQVVNPPVAAKPGPTVSDGRAPRS